MTSDFLAPFKLILFPSVLLSQADNLDGYASKSKDIPLSLWHIFGSTKRDHMAGRCGTQWFSEITSLVEGFSGSSHITGSSLTLSWALLVLLGIQGEQPQGGTP